MKHDLLILAGALAGAFLAAKYVGKMPDVGSLLTDGVDGAVKTIALRAAAGAVAGGLLVGRVL